MEENKKIELISKLIATIKEVKPTEADAELIETYNIINAYESKFSGNVQEIDVRVNEMCASYYLEPNIKLEDRFNFVEGLVYAIDIDMNLKDLNISSDRAKDTLALDMLYEELRINKKLDDQEAFKYICMGFGAGRRMNKDIAERKESSTPVKKR